MLNGLSFCSRTGLNDFAYDQCQESCVTMDSPFWNAVSKDYAQKAQADIYLFLNGQRSTGAISLNSTFIKYELPNLTIRVKKIIVFLIQMVDKTPHETCSNPDTLKTLQRMITEKGYRYECYDYYYTPLNILSPYEPSSNIADDDEHNTDISIQLISCFFLF